MPTFTIRLLLDNAPQLLRDIIENAVAESAHLTLLDPASSHANDPIDAVITAGESNPDRILYSSAAKRLIDVNIDGSGAVLYWLNTNAKQYVDLSPRDMVDLVTADLRGTADIVRLPDFPKKNSHINNDPSDQTESQSFTDTRKQNLPLQCALNAELASIVAHYVHPGRSESDTAGVGVELNKIQTRLSDAKQSDTIQLDNLNRLTELFQLTADERMLLFLSAIVEVNDLAAQWIALMNDHLRRRYPTVGLMQHLGADMLSLTSRLCSDGPLLRYGMITLEGDGPLTDQSVVCDSTLWPLLVEGSRRSSYQTVILDRRESLCLANQQLNTLQQLEQRILSVEDARRRLVIVGEQDVGRQVVARHVSSSWKKMAIQLDASCLASELDIKRLEREALWFDAVVIVAKLEELSDDLWRMLVGTFAAPMVLICQPQRWPRLALIGCEGLHHYEAPKRNRAHRKLLWQQQLGDNGLQEYSDALADRFDFGSSKIKTAIQVAEYKAHDNRQLSFDFSEILAACESLRETQFGGTAERLPCLYSSNDIILKPSTKRELSLVKAWAEHGSTLFEHSEGGAKNLHAGVGLACVFFGPPGTGKTMAAQILAREIDYALFRIDLSQIVDKYVGETEKHLSALFEEAQHSRVALFFDEADALYANRTEVSNSLDRHANLTVNHLLQQLEQFQGLTILSTNLLSNFDDAFLRRIRIKAEFPAPDQSERRKIWEKMLPIPELCDTDIDIPVLADSFRLVGGEIRNAVYTAHLLAASSREKLSMRHLVSGLWRELGKTGRISDVSQLGPWQDLIEPLNAMSA